MNGEVYQAGRSVVIAGPGLQCERESIAFTRDTEAEAEHDVRFVNAAIIQPIIEAAEARGYARCQADVVAYLMRLARQDGSCIELCAYDVEDIEDGLHVGAAEKGGGGLSNEHLADCDGNCSVPCHWCMGAGEYEYEEDDMPPDRMVDCIECDGRGFFRCPAALTSERGGEGEGDG